MKFSKNSKQSQADQPKPEQRKLFRAGVVIGVLGLLVGVGAVWAQFSSDTTVNAQGTTGSAKPLDSSAQVNGLMYPGFCNDVTMTLTNHNDVRVKITNVANSGFSPNSLGGALTQADVSSALNGQTLLSGETKQFTLPKAVCLSAANAGNPDQNVAFTAIYTVSANLSAGTDAP